MITINKKDLMNSIKEDIEVTDDYKGAVLLFKKKTNPLERKFTKIEENGKLIITNDEGVLLYSISMEAGQENSLRRYASLVYFEEGDEIAELMVREFGGYTQWVKVVD